MKVSITEDHIRRGTRKQCYACPVALAVQELYPDKCVTVTESYIRIYANQLSRKPFVRFPTPADVVKRIVCFDQTGVMEPFNADIQEEISA